MNEEKKPSKRSALQRELHKREAFASLEQEASLNIIRTSSALLAPFARLFKQYGLSQAQFNILRILEEEEEGLPTQEITARMVASVPDVTRLVDKLESAKLVERTRGTADRRVVRVTITREGQKLMTTLNPLVIEQHANNLEHMTVEELKEINRLMVKVRRAEE